MKYSVHEILVQLWLNTMIEPTNIRVTIAGKLPLPTGIGTSIEMFTYEWRLAVL